MINTTTTTTNKFNTLPGKLMLVIDDLYPAEVVSLWVKEDNKELFFADLYFLK